MAFICVDCWAGKLQDARDEVREGDSSTNSGGSSTDTDGDFETFDDTCDPEISDCEDGGGLLVAAIIGFAFHLPHLMIEDDDYYEMNGWFHRYPYRKDADGYMYIDWELIPEPEVEATVEGDYIIDENSAPADRPADTRPLALRLALEYSHDLDAIHKPAGYMMFSTRWRIGLEGGATYFREQINDQPADDQLGIGDINVIFRFAQHENIQMRAGMGVRLMFDDQQTNGGFNFTYGMDIYPVFPLVISGSVDLGNLGKAFQLHGRGTIGVVFFGVEIYAGWDAFLIGSVSIHGPTGGLRIWL